MNRLAYDMLNYVLVVCGNVSGKSVGLEGVRQREARTNCILYLLVHLTWSKFWRQLPDSVVEVQKQKV